MVALNTREITALLRSPITDVGLLLLVDLASVDDFFDCAGRNKAENFDIANLADAVGTILGLEIVAG